MKIQRDCLHCVFRSFLNKISKYHLPDKREESAIREFLRFLAQVDYYQTPPSLGKEIQNIIRKLLEDRDPYYKEKQESNQVVLKDYERFRKIISDSQDPFFTALKLSLLGNILDFAVHDNTDFNHIFQKVKSIQPEIDHTAQLKDELKNADKILYLCDNCGEIVFDKLFITEIKRDFPHLKIIVAVRGYPVLNDATIKDAKLIGLDKVVKVIENGSDVPGTILKDCSPYFNKFFW